MEKARKDYVRHPNEIDESWICFFCLDLCIDPIRCLGPCKTISCRRCASEWCENGRRSVSCPKKCLDPWRFELIPRQKMDMECPYSSTCRIGFVEDLLKHLHECPHSSTEVQRLNNMRKNYKCSNDHELKFFVGSFQEIVGSVCQECGEKGSSRSKCPKCGLGYCVSCRAPPCSKESCPLGHSYRFVKPAPKTMVCDMCGMSAGMVALGAYSDSKCNFDVCELCYQRLPQSNSQNEIVKRIREVGGNRCSNQHQLTVISEPHSQICRLCSKASVCWKQCKPCNQKYCLICKQPTVRTMQCEFRHKYVVRPGTKPCMMCNEQEPVLCLVDLQCNIRLCEVCGERLADISAQTHRMKSYLFCENRHVMTYSNQAQRRQCSGCGKERFLSVFCHQCEPRRGFCVQCQPLDWKETCYFGDRLQKISVAEDQPSRQCAVCQESRKGELWVCKHCKFEICEPCRRS